MGHCCARGVSGTDGRGRTLIFENQQQWTMNGCDVRGTIIDGLFLGEAEIARLTDGVD